MAKHKHAQPIYTRSGDKGTTGLIGPDRVAKMDPRIEAVGQLDELNSSLGLLRESIRGQFEQLSSLNTKTSTLNESVKDIDQQLEFIQHQIFTFGSHIAVSDESFRKHLPELKGLAPVLENWMDEHSQHLPELKNFILPGGGPAAATAHLARAIARRAERATVTAVGFIRSKSSEDTEAETTARCAVEIMRDLNRLGDYLFVVARRLTLLAEREEFIWKPS